MSIACYTSCSVNYLAKARVLAKSLKRFHPDASIVLCLNDVVPEWFDARSESFDEVWTPSDLGYDENWVFKHNVMELCTAVKGRALVRLMSEFRADLYAYFDPDVCVYASLDGVIEQMGDASIGLVPHITTPETSDIGVRMTEMSVTHHGIYNLGHLFVKADANGRALASWWADRLDRYCYNDPERGLFTDQRWMDLAPAIFDGVAILRSPDLDVASWNVSSRSFSGTAGDGYLVDGVPLRTYHFSGTGADGVHQRVRRIFNPCDATLAEIEREYEASIDAEDQGRLGDYPFAYDCFDNGRPITDAIRKYYRRNADLQQAFPQPFRAEPDGPTLFRWLAENRPDLVDAIGVRSDLLLRAFDDLFDAEFYRTRYPEVADYIAKGIYEDELDHYIRRGSSEGYDPNLLFDSEYYRERAQYYAGQNFLLGKSGSGAIEATLLWHYLSVGLRNGIEPNSFFDSRHYLRKNPDIFQAVQYGAISTALSHFLRHGDRECREPSSGMPLRTIYNRSPAVRDLIDRGVANGVVQALIMLNQIKGYVRYEVEIDASSSRDLSDLDAPLS